MNKIKNASSYVVVTFLMLVATSGFAHAATTDTLWNSIDKSTSDIFGVAVADVSTKMSKASNGQIIVNDSIRQSIDERANLLDIAAWKDPQQFMEREKKNWAMLSALKNKGGFGKQSGISFGVNIEDARTIDKATLVIQHVDKINGSEVGNVYHLIDNGGKVLDLSVTGDISENLTGKKFNVNGYQIGNHVVAYSEQFNSSTALNGDATGTTQSGNAGWSVNRLAKVLAVNVYRDNKDGVEIKNIPFFNIPQDYIFSKYFSDSSTINKYILENSYGKTSISVDIAPQIYTLSAIPTSLDTFGCISYNDNQIRNNILPQLQQDGIDISKYDIFLVFANVNCGVGIAGWGGIGLPYQRNSGNSGNYAVTTIVVSTYPPLSALVERENFFDGSLINLGNYTSVILHEFGHNFGTQFHSGSCINTSRVDQCHRVGAYAYKNGEYGEYSYLN